MLISYPSRPRFSPILLKRSSHLSYLLVNCKFSIYFTPYCSLSWNHLFVLGLLKYFLVVFFNKGLLRVNTQVWGKQLDVFYLLNRANPFLCKPTIKIFLNNSSIFIYLCIETKLSIFSCNHISCHLYYFIVLLLKKSDERLLNETIHIKYTTATRLLKRRVRRDRKVAGMLPICISRRCLLQFDVMLAGYLICYALMDFSES